MQDVLGGRGDVIYSNLLFTWEGFSNMYSFLAMLALPAYLMRFREIVLIKDEQRGEVESSDVL